MLTYADVCWRKEAGRYSVYLLCYYKSTKTDASAAETVEVQRQGMEQEARLQDRVVLAESQSKVCSIYLRYWYWSKCTKHWTRLQDRVVLVDSHSCGMVKKKAIWRCTPIVGAQGGGGARMLTYADVC
jgi:hypothetical protein